MDIKSWFERKAFKHAKLPHWTEARKIIPKGSKRLLDMSTVKIGTLPWIDGTWDRIFQWGIDPEFRIDFPYKQASGLTSTEENIWQYGEGCKLTMQKKQMKHNAVLHSNFKFKYGTVRALIKVPNVHAAWSAFWIFRGMPELDIMEHCGQWKNEIAATHHWGCGYHGEGKKSTLHNGRHNKDFHPEKEYYLYEVEVTPYKVTYKINGVTTRTLTNHIPSHEGHIIFDVTCEGTYCGVPPKNGLAEDAIMDVKWLEIYTICK